MDFHTHNLLSVPGTAIVNVPREWLMSPALFRPVPGGLYSAGIHPWWTGEAQDAGRHFAGLRQLSEHAQVVAVGECGLDRLRGADLEIQTALFRRQVELAEERGLPVTVHCVKAFDRLLHLCKLWRPKTQWTVHGFRGGPELAVQLLAAGIDLSLGRRYNPETLKVVPPERCHFETDEA